ncbi:hypothetical protein [Paenibacillus lactis]|uniref:hypothetical protein n=1 Tax=Paenibacillus lactis TaxID=228574 RepID=UPI003D75166B
MIDRLQAFLGIPHPISPKINIYSPTIKEIGQIGHINYMVNVQLSLFNKRTILLELFKISEEIYTQISNENDYDVLIDHPDIRNNIANALSFFVKDEVSYRTDTQSFVVSNEEFINKDNYLLITSIIKKLNGINEDISISSTSHTKPTNSRAAKMLEKIQSFEKKTASNDEGLELKDICSILCIAPDNGINIHNIGDLTVFQVFEQYERMTKKDEFNRALPIWANGHWNEKNKFPEWLVRTKI